MNNDLAFFVGLTMGTIRSKNKDNINILNKFAYETKKNE
jgi:hypothetical protein